MGITKQSIIWGPGYKFRVADWSEDSLRKQKADCPIWLLCVPEVINYVCSNNKSWEAANSKHAEKTKQNKMVVCFNEGKCEAATIAPEWVSWIQILPATDFSCNMGLMTIIATEAWNLNLGKLFNIFPITRHATCHLCALLGWRRQYVRSHGEQSKWGFVICWI